MSIRFHCESRTFFLDTQHTSYVMQVGPYGHLLHLYYGPSVGEGDFTALYPGEDRGFSPSYYEDRLERNFSPDVLPQEYTGCNVGDFRLSCLSVADEQGDWWVNTEKLPGGLDPLIARIHDLGMKFGLWVEPEMVSEESELYRAHPDWAFRLPGRSPAMGRNQLILDMGRKEVVDYIATQLESLLEHHAIDYIKWDMNRNMSDIYSHTLPVERQGEAAHRYMLGVYALLERLTQKFPHVLMEGCAGGGGRFDAGMLAYCPQIWCSDERWGHKCCLVLLLSPDLVQ